jgi:hypothetical protein
VIGYEHLLRSDTNKAYYCRISSRTGDILSTLITERLYMQKSGKAVSAKNNKNKDQRVVEEIAEILYNAIKRYIALPAAVKNG